MTDPAGSGPADRDGCWQDRHGSGPAIVLVHGMMDRATSFGRVVRRLHDHTVIRYDRRGYGRSIGLGPPESFRQQVDDLLAVVGDEPAVVFGHSYGGTIALAAAVRDPERVRGVVAYESPMPWLPWWPATSAGAAAMAAADDPEDAAEGFMRRMLGDERWVRLPPSTRRARRAEGATMVAELAHVRPPHEAPLDPAELTVPVTGAHGETGAAHHHRAAQHVAEHAPKGAVRAVVGAGHGIHLTHADAVVGLVEDLYARIDA